MAPASEKLTLRFLRPETMEPIILYSLDEYGYTDELATYETIDAAQFALSRMLDTAESCLSYDLQCAIYYLQDAIADRLEGQDVD